MQSAAPVELAVLEAASAAANRAHAFDKRIVVGGRIALATVFLLAWQFAPGRVVNADYTSRPTDVVAAWWELASGGILLANAAVTFGEFATGYALGAIVGLLLGCLLTQRDTTYEAVEPILLGIYAVPMVALAPLFVLWLGVGVSSKIALAAYATSIMVLLSTADGIRAVGQRRVKMAQLLGAGTFQLYRLIILPAAVPLMLAALRVTIPIAMVAVILCELLGSRAGLGHLISQFASFLAVDKLMATVLTLGAMVMAMRMALAPLEARASSFKYYGT